MKNVFGFKWAAALCIASFVGTATAKDVLNDPELSRLLGKGALKEGMICGVSCLREKGKMYVLSSTEKSDPNERQVMDAGAWYSYVNAHRMLDTAYKQGGVSENDKKTVAAQIRELDSIIMTIGTKGFGWSKDQVSNQYVRTRQYLEAQIEQLTK